MNFGQNHVVTLVITPSKREFSYCLSQEEENQKKLYTKHIEPASEDSDSELKFCLNTINELTLKPIMVTLEVESISLQMELDTGAA